VENANRKSAVPDRKRSACDRGFYAVQNDDDAGALIVSDTDAEHAVKLTAGAPVLYPSARLHRVDPNTRGRRRASFFWVQSKVREDGRRGLLSQIDKLIQALSIRSARRIRRS
jgi:PKHD-type hydroxylase